MPKRKCSLTRKMTKRDPNDPKKHRKCDEDEADDLEQCIRNSNSIYIFTSEIRELDQIDRVLKELQHDIGLSRIFVGNEAARVALITADTKIKNGVCKLSKCLEGKCRVVINQP